MSIGRSVVIIGVVFGIALAVVVGQRMSAEAMAVVVGVVCGVAAGIPTAALLLVVMSRRDRLTHQPIDQVTRAGGSPPVVVIQGGAPQALPQRPEFGYWPALSAPTHTQRRFELVGDDELVEDGWR